ncbi:MAG: four-helix bundle copper-binding protein [Rhodocyclaceae bacterium]|nr:four-helix bundle copper-binding protein [Rhodocyclaceae bacterium]
MERRALLTGLAGVALAGVASRALAQHEHHHAASPARDALVDAAGACVARGEACLAHCLVLMGDGDTTIAACSRSVNETIAACSALQKLAAQKSSHAPKMAALTEEICRACEDECRKHEDKHAECKACAEACADCAKACKAFAA